MCKEGMPSHKEIEKEIQKINKEIAKLQWDLKNEVLTPRQKVVKQNKLKQLKKTRKELMQQVEGWRVWSSKVCMDPEQVSHHPRWINGEALPMNRLSWRYLGCKQMQMQPDVSNARGHCYRLCNSAT